MKIARQGNFKPNISEIKEKYSIQAFKIRLMTHIESLF